MDKTDFYTFRVWVFLFFFNACFSCGSANTEDKHLFFHGLQRLEFVAFFHWMNFHPTCAPASPRQEVKVLPGHLTSSLLLRLPPAWHAFSSAVSHNNIVWAKETEVLFPSPVDLLLPIIDIVAQFMSLLKVNSADLWITSSRLKYSSLWPHYLDDTICSCLAKLPRSWRITLIRYFTYHSLTLVHCNKHFWVHFWSRTLKNWYFNNFCLNIYIFFMYVGVWVCHPLSDNWRRAI